MAFLHDLVKDCIQFEQAFCTAKCPFNLDVRDFIGKIQQGRFNVAYKTYQYTVGFPGIVSALCHQPCREVCPMADNGGAISVRKLEAASISYARTREPDQYNMPTKPQRIAIVGGGISGLACALRLSTKKYNVTLFEKSDRIGGHLHGLMDSETLLEDIALQFKNEDYNLQLNTEIQDIATLPFDAVYVATGKDGNRFGLSLTDEGPYSTDRNGVFMGGSLTGANTMEAIAQGLNVSSAIEGYLKTGQMNHTEPLLHQTQLTYDAIRMIPAPAVAPANGVSFTREEALAEAKRCLRCTCDACVYYSPLMNHFQKFPRKITEDVEISINPSSLDGEATVATRLIAMCNHCGLCKEVCPKDIDVGEFLLQSHHTMREKGKMPWAFHEFYLRDMEFANSSAGLTRMPNGHDTCGYLFFPGCQIGASDPRMVMESYRFLLKTHPDTALMLGCCGAPADWAGNEPIHSEVIDRIRSDWKRLGEPTAILACTMCKQMFQRYLPEIKTEFIYTLLEQDGYTPKGNSNVAASIFDPCAARHEEQLQTHVRSIAQRAGYSLEPLPMERRLAECCSYGGQIGVAHPPYTRQIVERRIGQSENPYIAYCTNCRDIFAKAGKETVHILDIVFGLERRPQPTVSERQHNRLILKKQVLKEFWNEDMDMEKEKIKLSVSPGLKEKLDRDLILETDLMTVISHCESTGSKLFDPEKGTFTGHLQVGNMTFWVEYRATGNNEFELVNSYSHRMKIED